MAKWGEIKCPRCAELEAQITAMEEGLTAVHMAGYIDGKRAAEAKLAKAVEALVEPKVIWVNEYPDELVAHHDRLSAISSSTPRATRIAVKCVEAQDD